MKELGWNASIDHNNGNMKKTILVIVAVVSLLVLGNGLYAYLNNTANTER